MDFEKFQEKHGTPEVPPWSVEDQKQLAEILQSEFPQLGVAIGDENHGGYVYLGMLIRVNSEYVDAAGCPLHKNGDRAWRENQTGFERYDGKIYSGYSIENWTPPPTSGMGVWNAFATVRSQKQLCQTVGVAYLVAASCMKEEEQKGSPVTPTLEQADNSLTWCGARIAIR